MEISGAFYTATVFHKVSKSHLKERVHRTIDEQPQELRAIRSNDMHTASSRSKV